jgi:N-acetylmuramoyl-L-alanine amidase
MSRALPASFEPDFAGSTRVVPAVNFNERAVGTTLDTVILHYTGMTSEAAAIDWLACEESKVSCHYFVHEDGRVVQLVPERMRAWHAGASIWKGESDLNSRSIGIEIANPGHEHGYRNFPDRQVEAVIDLCLDCGNRRRIRPERFLAHSDVAPQRKQDPGEKFPWGRLYDNGVGHWVEPAIISGGRFLQHGDKGEPVEALQSMLSLYGYGTEITGEFDASTRFDVIAFQRHFRPARVDGIADASTIDTLYRLLSSVPQRG